MDAMVSLLGLETAGLAGPAFDVGPSPDQTLAKLRYGLWEVGVAAPPGVDDLRPCHTEALGDFRCPDELVAIRISCHGPFRRWSSRIILTVAGVDESGNRAEERLSR